MHGADDSKTLGNARAHVVLWHVESDNKGFLEERIWLRSRQGDGQSSDKRTADRVKEARHLLPESSRDPDRRSSIYVLYYLTCSAVILSPFHFKRYIHITLYQQKSRN